MIISVMPLYPGSGVLLYTSIVGSDYPIYVGVNEASVGCTTARGSCYGDPC